MNAGKEVSHELEDVAVEVSRERSIGKDADNIDRNDPAISKTTKEKQLKTQIFTSHSSQRTSMPGAPLLRLKQSYNH